MACPNCSTPLRRKSHKHCSNKCQAEYQYKKYIGKWKKGLISGNKGKSFPQISNHLRRYLTEKHGEKCWQCGWDKHHLLTGKVPLEINHIDGDAFNNNESNLQLLCPNCHSLTANFRNLNKGNGRQFRRKI